VFPFCSVELGTGEAVCAGDSGTLGPVQLTDGGDYYGCGVVVYIADCFVSYTDVPQEGGVVPDRRKHSVPECRGLVEVVITCYSVVVFTDFVLRRVSPGPICH